MALLYAKTHEWYDAESGKVGISAHAAEALVDIVFVDLPEPGTQVNIGDSFAFLESVKAVSDVFSPAAGVITEVNEALKDHPELINEDAQKAWFVVIKAEKTASDLMDKESYEAYCKDNPEA
ncbi:MAG: glycine cleavage system protein GcvH [Christensenellales bacterium]|jgi:glycine cleavage system H protein